MVYIRYFGVDTLSPISLNPYYLHVTLWHFNCILLWQMKDAKPFSVYQKNRFLILIGRK